MVTGVRHNEQPGDLEVGEGAHSDTHEVVNNIVGWCNSDTCGTDVVRVVNNIVGWCNSDTWGVYGMRYRLQVANCRGYSVTQCRRERTAASGFCWRRLPGPPRCPSAH